MDLVEEDQNYKSLKTLLSPEEEIGEALKSPSPHATTVPERVIKDSFERDLIYLCRLENQLDILKQGLTTTRVYINKVFNEKEISKRLKQQKILLMKQKKHKDNLKKRHLRCTKKDFSRVPAIRKFDTPVTTSRPTGIKDPISNLSNQMYMYSSNEIEGAMIRDVPTTTKDLLKSYSQIPNSSLEKESLDRGDPDTVAHDIISLSSKNRKKLPGGIATLKRNGPKSENFKDFLKDSENLTCPINGNLHGSRLRRSKSETVISYSKRDKKEKSFSSLQGARALALSLVEKSEGKRSGRSRAKIVRSQCKLEDNIESPDGTSSINGDDKIILRVESNQYNFSDMECHRKEKTQRSLSNNNHRPFSPKGTSERESRSKARKVGNPDKSQDLKESPVDATLLNGHDVNIKTRRKTAMIVSPKKGNSQGCLQKIKASAPFTNERSGKTRSSSRNQTDRTHLENDTVKIRVDLIQENPCGTLPENMTNLEAFRTPSPKDFKIIAKDTLEKVRFDIERPINKDELVASNSYELVPLKVESRINQAVIENIPEEFIFLAADGFSEEYGLCRKLTKEKVALMTVNATKSEEECSDKVSAMDKSNPTTESNLKRHENIEFETFSQIPTKDTTSGDNTIFHNSSVQKSSIRKKSGIPVKRTDYINSLVAVKKHDNFSQAKGVAAGLKSFIPRRVGIRNKQANISDTQKNFEPKNPKNPRKLQNNNLSVKRRFHFSSK